MTSKIWIDGRPAADRLVQVRLHDELHGRAQVWAARATGRPLLRSVVGWRELGSARIVDPPADRTLQVFLPELGRGFVMLGARETAARPWRGPVFELDGRGVEVGGWSWEFATPSLLVDQRRLELPLVAARVAPLGEHESVAGWVDALVELELGPGELDGDELVELTQPRTARRLGIGAGEGVIMAEVGCRRALVIGAPDRPQAGDAPLRVQLLVSGRAPRPTQAGELEPLPAITVADFRVGADRLEAFAELCHGVDRHAWTALTCARAPTGADELEDLVERIEAALRERREPSFDLAIVEDVGDPTGLIERVRGALPEPLRKVRIELFDPPRLAELAPPELPQLWLRRACAHAQRLEAVERRLVERLDREPLADIDADEWVVLADLLDDRGDPRGLELRAGEPPSAALERSLWTATRSADSRWRLPDREWAPRVRGRWHGPFLISLAIEPGWIRLAEPPRADSQQPSASFPAQVDFEAGLPTRMVNPAAEWLDELFDERPREPESPRLGELLELGSWMDTPGFDARPELLELLRMPCCRLLSPRRVVLAGERPPSLEHVGAMLEGADLRELVLAAPVMARVCLRGADLRGLTIAEGDLCGADLRGADLRGAGFVRTDLCGADLRGADLRGCVLEHVGVLRMLGVTLQGAKILADDAEQWRANGVDLLDVWISTADGC